MNGRTYDLSWKGIAAVPHFSHWQLSQRNWDFLSNSMLRILGFCRQLNPEKFWHSRSCQMHNEDKREVYQIELTLLPRSCKFTKTISHQKCWSACSQLNDHILLCNIWISSQFLWIIAKENLVLTQLQFFFVTAPKVLRKLMLPSQGLLKIGECYEILSPIKHIWDAEDFLEALKNYTKKDKHDSKFTKGHGCNEIYLLIKHLCPHGHQGYMTGRIEIPRCKIY